MTEGSLPPSLPPLLSVSLMIITWLWTMRDKAPPDERTETADWDTSLGAPCVLIRLTVRAQTCDEETPSSPPRAPDGV